MVPYNKMVPTHTKKYYIEFVGQHTAGKTVTIRSIVDRELLTPKKAIYPQQLHRSSFHFITHLPLLIIRNAGHLWFVIKFLFCYARWSWINYHAAGRHLLKMVLLHPYYCAYYDFDIWMKDDMLHLLSRINFKKGVVIENVFREYISHFSYLYDGIVYIDIPYDVMKDRFDDRFSNRDQGRRKNRIPVYERAFHQNIVLRKILVEQTHIPLLILDGMNDISENAQRVAAFIKTHVYKS